MLSISSYWLVDTELGEHEHSSTLLHIARLYFHHLIVSTKDNIDTLLSAVKAGPLRLQSRLSLNHHAE